MDVGREIEPVNASVEELDVRVNELYHAMLLVDQSGVSPELTEAINKLGERMTVLAGIRTAAKKDAAATDRGKQHEEMAPLALGTVDEGG